MMIFTNLYWNWLYCQDKSTFAIFKSEIPEVLAEKNSDFSVCMPVFYLESPSNRAKGYDVEMYRKFHRRSKFFKMMLFFSGIILDGE